MKTLFICRANVGRSQIGNGLYNQMHPGKSSSAGTLVELPGQKLKDRKSAVNVLATMKERGVDLSESVRTQVTEELIADFDRLIVMAEPETIPGWLMDSPKTIIWTVKDTLDQDMESTREIAEHIKERISELDK